MLKFATQTNSNIQSLMVVLTFEVKPCEVTFLLKHKNMSTSLKFMIKENEEIHKQISAYSIIPASRVKLIAFKCYECPKICPKN